MRASLLGPLTALLTLSPAARRQSSPTRGWPPTSTTRSSAASADEGWTVTLHWQLLSLIGIPYICHLKVVLGTIIRSGVGRNDSSAPRLGLTDCVKKIAKADGVQGLYRGYGPSVPAPPRASRP
jgi:hypothetical protein